MVVKLDNKHLRKYSAQWYLKSEEDAHKKKKKKMQVRFIGNFYFALFYQLKKGTITQWMTLLNQQLNPRFPVFILPQVLFKQ